MTRLFSGQSNGSLSCNFVGFSRLPFSDETGKGGVTQTPRPRREKALSASFTIALVWHSGVTARERHRIAGLSTKSCGGSPLIDMRYIGIDPGKTGGLAVIEKGKPYAIAMPDTESEIRLAIVNFAVNANSGPCFALIEKIQPHWGHDPSGPRILMGFHKLAISYGFLRGLLTALEIPFDEIQPAKWQKMMGCLTHGDKNISKGKAQQLYPGVKITHYTADAILLARTCEELHQKRLEKWDDI